MVVRRPCSGCDSTTNVTGEGNPRDDGWQAGHSVSVATIPWSVVCSPPFLFSSPQSKCHDNFVIEYRDTPFPPPPSLSLLFPFRGRSRNAFVIRASGKCAVTITRGGSLHATYMYYMRRTVKKLKCGLAKANYLSDL